MLLLNDFNTSVEKALSEIDPNWRKLPGIIVCGTHKPVPEKIYDFYQDIKMARENNQPFLGICFGMQLMAIEYMENVVGLKNATSEEFGNEGPKVVKKMPELRVGLHAAFYGETITNESFWHNYKVDVDSFPQLWDGFEIKEVNDVITYMRLKDRENFFGVQFHPEYQSSKDNPHPLLVKFLDICKTQK